MSSGSELGAMATASYAQGISDFHRAAARVGEGVCPLCGGSLVNGSSDELTARTCDLCDVSWQLTTVDGRPMITPTRKLSAREVRLLYNRG